MATIRNAILKKRIDNVMSQLAVKTKTEMVYLSDDVTTLDGVLNRIDDNIEDIYSKLGSVDTEELATQINEALDEFEATLNDTDDPNSIASQLSDLSDSIDAITNPSTGAAATAKAYTDTKLGLSGTEYADGTVKEYVDAVADDIRAANAGAFHYKGAVNYTNLLPVENVENGSVYQVRYRGTSGEDPLNAEYVYNGSEWEELGSVVDLSNYATSSAVASAINTAKQEAIDNTANAISAVNTTINTMKDDSVTGSLANKIKANETAITALNDGTTGAEAKAKAYTDTKVSTVVGSVPGAVGDTNVANVIEYIDAKVSKATQAANSGSGSAETNANLYTDEKIGTIPAKVGDTDTSDVISYVDAKALEAENNAVSLAVTGDNAVKAIIGGAYTSSNTVAADISSVKDDIDDINDSIGSGFDSTNTVKKYIDDQDNSIKDIIGSGFTSSKTVASTIVSAQTAVINDIKAIIGGTYTSSNTVAADISSVKDDIDDINDSIGGNFNSTNTVSSAISDARTNAVSDVNEILGSGFSSSSTVKEYIDDKYAFKTVKVGNNNIVADSSADTIEIEGSDQIAITGDVSDDKIVISHATSGVTPNISTGYGSSTKVPIIKVNDTGHVTAVEEVTITGATPASHYHGNITNDGKITAENVVLATGDAFAIVDASDSNRIAKTSIAIDTADTTKYLRHDGTWVTPPDTKYTPASVDPENISSTSAAVGTDTEYARQDHIHKIELGTGDAPGEVKIAGKNIAVNGLGSAAYKDIVDTYSADGTNAVSGKAVAEAIASLPNPMVFKGSLGTGGTITVLPIDGTASVGDTYKVITDGTYAGDAAKIGDTFICKTKSANTNTWELIPSGDEPSGTVTSITLNATSPIVIDNTSAITTSGERTISHAVSGVTVGTYGGATKAAKVTVDASGHVTAAEEVTITGVTPASHYHGNITNDGKITTTGSTENADVLVSAGSDNKVKKSAISIDTTDTTKYLRHDGTWVTPPDTKYTHPSSSADGTYGGATKTAKVTVDAYGHVTAAEEVTITGVTPASHYHGNITNDGKITAENVVLATGDAFAIVDASDSNRIAKTSIAIDTADTTKYLRHDGTWVTPTNTTYSAMGAASASAAGTAGLVPAPAAGKQNSFLRGDGTWVVPTNTTYSSMGAASASAAGTAGLVPAPAAGKQNSFLRGDGTWVVPTDTNVTQTPTTENKNYEVLFSATDDNTARTEGSRKNSNLKFNPSTGNLQVTKINGVDVGSSPKFTDNNTTYSSMGAASASAAGTAGLVPAPAAGKQNSFLRGDGTWVVPTDTKYTHPAYTAYTGKPTANQTPAFGNTFTVSQVTSDATGHVTNITDRTVKIPNATATSSAAGLMSAADKEKLDKMLVISEAAYEALNPPDSGTLYFVLEATS